MLEPITLEDASNRESHQADVWPDELLFLNKKYGPANFYFAHLSMGEDYFARWRYVRYTKQDRRGEVVFAIQNSHGQLLLHTKPVYPNHVYRLPSGGIKEDEAVLAGLFRETYEETGLKPVGIELISVILYEFEHNSSKIPFSSYVFLMTTEGQKPQVQDSTEDISGFKWVEKDELDSVVQELQQLPNQRWQDWGEMRALAHEAIIKKIQENNGK